MDIRSVVRIAFVSTLMIWQVDYESILGQVTGLTSECSEIADSRPVSGCQFSPNSTRILTGGETPAHSHITDNEAFVNRMDGIGKGVDCSWM